MGRVAKLGGKSSLFSKVTFIDNRKFYAANAEPEDGTYESVILLKIAEHVIHNVINKISKIGPVALQIALKDGTEVEKFTRSGC